METRPRATEHHMKTKRSFKERIIDELKTFAGMAIYLWVVFGLFQLHQQIVLNQYHVPVCPSLMPLSWPRSC
jgi:hypothetical protein